MTLTTERPTTGELLCIHEAGHAVWAVLTGSRIVECYARSGGGEVRIAEESPHGPAISYAGVYSECRAEYGRLPSLERLRDAWRNASDVDREHFGDAAVWPRHIEGDLEFLMPRIRALGTTLYRRGSATHSDVERFLGVSEATPLPLVRSLIKARIPLMPTEGAA